MRPNCSKAHRIGKAVIVLCLVISGMCGCDQGTSNKPFYLGISKKTVQHLDYAYVQLPGFQTIDNQVMPGGGFTDGPIPVARPDVFLVRWATRQSPDEEHEVEVDLTGQVPQDFDGTIYFIINQDFSVSVQVREYDKAPVPSKPFGRFLEKGTPSNDAQDTKEEENRP